MEWTEHFAREQERYRDGQARLPDVDDPDARQKQLTRMGNAAGGAGLALLMQGRDGEATEWFSLAAERYRESFADAPPGSWGRPIGAIKSLLMGGDWDGAPRPPPSGRSRLVQPTPSRRSASTQLASRCSCWRATARRASLADDLRTHDGFPTDVADSLAMISAQDVAGYQLAVESVLDSFESRDEYLEDIPVADTVIVLQTLALQRDMAADLESQLLP